MTSELFLLASCLCTTLRSSFLFDVSLLLASLSVLQSLRLALCFDKISFPLLPLRMMNSTGPLAQGHALINADLSTSFALSHRNATFLSSSWLPCLAAHES